ncbi:hypothetical protein KC326_g166 [Hortaea werneckii]|nr:hypothetical protein KC326_g166 [Hortaea werneckii]
MFASGGYWCSKFSKPCFLLARDRNMDLFTYLVEQMDGFARYKPTLLADSSLCNPVHDLGQLMASERNCFGWRLAAYNRYDPCLAPVVPRRRLMQDPAEPGHLQPRRESCGLETSADPSSRTNSLLRPKRSGDTTGVAAAAAGKGSAQVGLMRSPPPWQL